MDSGLLDGEDSSHRTMIAGTSLDDRGIDAFQVGRVEYVVDAGGDRQGELPV